MAKGGSIMSDNQILDLIGQMRSAQDLYFRLRRVHGVEANAVIDALREARRLEEWVDLWLAKARAGHATMFQPAEV